MSGLNNFLTAITKKRILVLAGHYGSGKTQIAINSALLLRRHFERVALADLDIVNPYFRTRDSAETLLHNDISLITSEYAGSNAEVASIPPGAAAVLDDDSLRAVLDVGGDDRGALALGRYAKRLENAAEVALVLNVYRPLTAVVHDVTEIMREIESAGHLRFTALINNSNLGSETTVDDVLRSAEYALKVENETGLPLLCHTVRDELAPGLEGRLDDVFPIQIFRKTTWRID